MDKPDIVELAPCPCCGSGPAKGFGRYTQASFSGVELMDPTNMPYVWCGTCCLRTRTCESQAEAIAAWNQRANTPEITRLRAQLAAAREGLGGLLRLFLPIDMQIAQAEMAEQPVDPNAVLFSFMGSGASDHVTVGEYLAATDSARTTLAALKEADNG